MAESGCDELTPAPESGSKRMLEINRKRVDLEHVLEIVARFAATTFRSRSAPS